MHATFFILSIEHDHVVIKYRSTIAGARVTRTVTSLDDLNAFLESKASEAGMTVCELDIMYSSTMDFPRESTRNDATLALVRDIIHAKETA